MNELGDFFNLIGEEKKKKVEKNKVEKKETKTESLDSLFVSISEEKKKEKKRKQDIIGEVSLDSLFSSLSEEKKKLKETEVKKRKELDQLEKEAKIFETFLFSDTVKKDSGEKIEIESSPIIEEKEESKYVEELETRLKKLKTHTYKSIDRLMKSIAKKYEITPKVLHDDFKSKHDMIPDEWIKQFIDKKENVEEEVDSNIQSALDVLNKIKRNDDDIENEEDKELRKLKLEVEQLRKMVYETMKSASAQGGGGEVRLEFLDDIDRDSAKVDGKVLKYDASAGIWTGADVSSSGVSTFSGDYNELINKPTIPSDTGDLTNSVGFITSGSLVGYATEGYVDAAVSGVSTFSGDYNDLTNQPTIPDTSTLMPKSGGTFTGNVDLNNTVYLRLGNDKDNIIGYTGAINLFRFTDNTRISGDTMFFTTYNGVEYMRLSTTFGTQLKHEGITKLTVDSTGINVNGQLNDLTIPSGTGTIAITADIPTNNNELTNGRGYITSSSLVGYATEGYVDAAVSGVSVGSAGTWASDNVGIYTSKNVSIGTTQANSNYALYVDGDSYFNGNISVAGTITYDDVTNVDSLGIGTFRNGIEVNAGTAQTALLVRGDARITGILTVGKSSVIIDGDNNTITVGDVLITGSSVTIGDNVVINSGATGINSAPNVLYVAKDGNDSNNGTSIDNAKLTISGAVGAAKTGTIIKVLAGNYSENNPIEVPAFVSIVGDDLKTVTVTPNTANDDIFHVRKGSYLANMTFTNHIAPAAAVGFPTSEIATNIGGGKWESPYIQNCTSNTTTGIGLRIDGAQAESLKSIVVDSYTQYNQGGVGVAITNSGFAQLVSVFTICCNEAITCHKGSTCDLTNSNSSFGTFGLVSDGVSDEQFTGIVTSVAAAAQDTITIGLSTTTRPYSGQVVYFGDLFKTVQTITVGSGGTGYTSTPTVTIDSPTGPNGERATAFATLQGDSVSSITIISGGNQYQTVPNITIGSPNVGLNTATATATMSPIYYTINSSTPIVSGISTITLEENLINSVGVGTTVHFFQQSKIVASSHTFEYVGSGNDITSATPLRGGVSIQENEVVTSNGGNVVYTSTDQSGNFRIGDDFEINQNTGTISGRAFSKSLFSEMTPFILALS